LPRILASLRPEAKGDSAVAQALRVGVALQLDDLVSVLQELPTMHGLGAALLAPQLPTLRERALSALCKAYVPSLPLELLTRHLGFADDDSRGCQRFLRSLGTVPAPSSSGIELDTRLARKTLSERAEAARREALAAAAAHTGADTVPAVGPAIPFDLLGGPDW
jgi:hypothetical protein